MKDNPRNMELMRRMVEESMATAPHVDGNKEVAALIYAAREMVNKFPRGTLPERMTLAHNLEEALKPFDNKKGIIGR